jgi:hypothetical protein
LSIAPRSLILVIRPLHGLAIAESQA